MGRFIVVVIDSFGIGAMDDVISLRPQDIGANTCKHILEIKKDLSLPTLEDLGLINALGEKVNVMEKSTKALFGKANLMHYGGDTFFGHQEIMGTLPKKPLVEPFSSVIDSIAKTLLELGYKVEYIGDGPRLLLINNSMTIGDNLEADLGQVYNITATFDKVSFEDTLKVGRVVRDIAKVARVITFGGEGVDISQILGAIEVKNPYIGVNAPRSGVYNTGYLVRHLGYGIDYNKQVQTLIGKEGIPSVLIGKVADIVENPYGVSHIGIVDTDRVFQVALEEIEKNKGGFFCINIQETDLAGHSEDIDKYAQKLEVSDRGIEDIISLLNREDILIVTADHGNDPTIGHSKHTREMVPLLIYTKNRTFNDIGIRDTLSDIGATASDYFKVDLPHNGTSFLEDISLKTPLLLR